MSHIQALRAYAAVAVVLSHLSARSDDLLHRPLWSDQLLWGTTGVDTFFVISGFIIVTVHRRDVSRPSRLRSYVIKRLVRIFPIYWLVTLIALPIYLAGYGDETKRTVEVILRSIVLYPQDPGVFPVINVAWTLSFEIFFYFVFALLIALPLRWGAAISLAWIAPCAIVFITLVTGISHPHGGLVWQFIFNPRNLEFALGALIAVVGRRVVLPRPGVWLLAGLATIVGFAAFTTLAPSPVYYPSVVFTALPSAVMVMAAAQLDREGLAAPRVLEAIGDASYSLYLVHFGVVTGVYLSARELGLVNDVTWPFVLILACAAAIAAALLSYRWVEAPVLRTARRRLLGETTPRPPYVSTA